MKVNYRPEPYVLLSCTSFRKSTDPIQNKPIIIHYYCMGSPCFLLVVMFLEIKHKRKTM